MEMERNISDLPRPMLHHILSSLSQKDAVKTCVLSKSWRNLWYGRPNVVFNKDRFKGSVEEFLSVLDQTLIRYTNQNLSIQQFILKMPTIDPMSAQFLEEWIPIIVTQNKGIETFHLRFHWTDLEKQSIFFKPKYFDLGSVDFKSECLREIYLEGCKLNQIEKVYFRHLRTLRFRGVTVEEETFARIMSSCPLIQEVSLDQCKGFKTITVNKHNCSLKNFEVQMSLLCADTKIEIADVSRIETINIKRCLDWFEHHRNHIFTHLKSLHLSHFKVTTKSLEIFSRNFPCLEDLELSDCFTFLEEFQLSCHSVKRLAIIELFGREISITIDAPNLLEFKYEAYAFPSHISFSTISNKWKSEIVLKTNLDDSRMALSQWLHELDELLKVFNQSETFVHVRVQRDDDEWRFLCEAYPATKKVVKHLDLCLGSLCSDFSVWLEVEREPTWKWNSNRKSQSSR